MKNKLAFSFCTGVLIICFAICYFILFPSMNNLDTSANNEIYDLHKLMNRQNELINRLDKIEASLTDSASRLNDLDIRVSDIESNIYSVKTHLAHYYVDKLSDKSYTKKYNHDYIFYTAAEALGELGKPSIPILISKLEYSYDSYETALIFYSLLLASQSPDVSCFTNNNYIKTYLDFDATTHPEKKEVVKQWWNTYKDNF